MKMNNEDYKKHLLERGFKEDEIEVILEQRASMESCTVEMFKELVRQGAIKRTRKLRANRSLYVNEDGYVMYLEYYRKQYNYCGYFVN